MGVRQGEMISEYLAAMGLPWNKSWAGAAAQFSPSHDGVLLAGGMRITLLSPRSADLQRLAKQWNHDLARTRGNKENPGAAGFTAAASVDPERRDILVIHAHEDETWARLIRARSRTSIYAKRWAFWAYDELTREANLEEALHASLATARVAMLLLSPAMLGSNFFRGIFTDLIAAGKSRAPEVTTVTVTGVRGTQHVLDTMHPLLEPDVVLDELKTRAHRAAIGRIVVLLEQRANLAKEADRPSTSAKESGSINVEALANSKFAGDRSVVNGASIALLAEFHDRAVLVGGDARADVLCESIATLLSRRKKPRLRLDAFVVPHAGSRSNMSRELLALLDCDRYLISSDGRLFGHPHRETIARIIMYGRASADRRPTLVFNYRSQPSEIWSNPELQQRYAYSAVYPEPGSAGIKVQL
jgi:hypothetical protein